VAVFTAGGILLALATDRAGRVADLSVERARVEEF
jgi:hypothetical protein